MYNTIFNAVLSFGVFFGGLTLILLLALKTRVRQAREERRFNEWHTKGDESEEA